MTLVTRDKLLVEPKSHRRDGDVGPPRKPTLPKECGADTSPFPGDLFIERDDREGGGDTPCRLVRTLSAAGDLEEHGGRDTEGATLPGQFVQLRARGALASQ